MEEKGNLIMDSIRVEDIIGIGVKEYKDNKYISYNILYQTEWDKKNKVFSAITITRDKEKLMEMLR